jgi:hypothetical protein
MSLTDGSVLGGVIGSTIGNTIDGFVGVLLKKKILD